MRHEMTTTKGKTTTIYIYGTTGKHGAYCVRMYVVGHTACAGVYIHDAEWGDYEVCEVNNVDWNHYGRRDMIADLMGQVVREGYHLPALYLLADLAEDMR